MVRPAQFETPAAASAHKVVQSMIEVSDVTNTVVAATIPRVRRVAGKFNLFGLLPCTQYRKLYARRQLNESRIVKPR